MLFFTFLCFYMKKSITFDMFIGKDMRNIDRNSSFCKTIVYHCSNNGNINIYTFYYFLFERTGIDGNILLKYFFGGGIPFINPFLVLLCKFCVHVLWSGQRISFMVDLKFVLNLMLMLCSLLFFRGTKIYN